MNLILLGYGKMGKEVEKIALQRHHKIVSTIDVYNYSEFTSELAKSSDVAIEFTSPHTAVKNIITCFEYGLPVVCGSTGWYNDIEKVTEACKKFNGSLFYASNFSLGVNIFFRINKYLAQVMNNFNEYDVEITETHHTQKLDAPSGTAITLANDIIKNLNRKKTWSLTNASKAEELKIEAIRKDAIPGIHTIKYESDVDFIEITHSAKNRKGLALGAILAAEFLSNKKGIFGMNDLLNL